VSGDLVNWSSAAANVAQPWLVGEEPTRQIFAARDLAPAPLATQRFIRLKITKP
jgi:hypothetical protein